MILSARNQLKGKVEKITDGAVNGIVTIDVNGTPVSATISMASISELGLETGKAAYAVIKATEVMIGKGEHLPLSARNQFPGEVISVEKGAVNAIVAEMRCPQRFPMPLWKNSDLKQAMKPLLLLRLLLLWLGLTDDRTRQRAHFPGDYYQVYKG